MGIDPEVVGNGSVVLALFALVAHLLRQNHVDRKQSLEREAAAAERNDKAIAATEARYEKRVNELTEDLEEQRDAYDMERRARIKAEDEAATYKRRAEARPGGGPS